eukprot:358334-Chlamydomonas_euryale.AAC.9
MRGCTPCHAKACVPRHSNLVMQHARSSTHGSRTMQKAASAAAAACNKQRHGGRSMLGSNGMLGKCAIIMCALMRT